jgi:hypothetical protein
MWKTDPKINIYIKTSTIIYTNSDVKHVCNSGNYSMELRERGKGKEKLIEHQ